MSPRRLRLPEGQGPLQVKLFCCHFHCQNHEKHFQLNIKFCVFTGLFVQVVIVLLNFRMLDYAMFPCIIFFFISSSLICINI